MKIFKKNKASISSPPLDDIPPIIEETNSLYNSGFKSEYISKKKESDTTDNKLSPTTSEFLDVTKSNRANSFPNNEVQTRSRSSSFGSTENNGQILSRYSIDESTPKVDVMPIEGKKSALSKTSSSLKRKLSFAKSKPSSKEKEEVELLSAKLRESEERTQKMTGELETLKKKLGQAVVMLKNAKFSTGGDFSKALLEKVQLSALQQQETKQRMKRVLELLEDLLKIIDSENITLEVIQKQSQIVAARLEEFEEDKFIEKKFSPDELEEEDPTNASKLDSNLGNNNLKDPPLPLDTNDNANLKIPKIELDKKRNNSTSSNSSGNLTIKQAAQSGLIIPIEKFLQELEQKYYSLITEFLEKQVQTDNLWKEKYQIENNKLVTLEQQNVLLQKKFEEGQNQLEEQKQQSNKTKRELDFQIQELQDLLTLEKDRNKKLQEKSKTREDELVKANQALETRLKQLEERLLQQKIN